MQETKRHARKVQAGGAEARSFRPRPFQPATYGGPQLSRQKQKPQGKNKILHGKTENLTAKTKYLTTKPKPSRQNQRPHGKTKYFSAKTKYLTAKANTSQQKPNTSRQKQIPTAKPKPFCFFCFEVFGFAVRFLVLL